MGTHGDPAKWNMPGWRIEQRFANSVLIGNWSEERNTFNKGNQKHNSTHRVDFQNFGSSKPDVVIRRNAELRNDGLGKEYLFYHHGKRYSNNMISWYDEHYNNRVRDPSDQLPDLRHWDGHRLAWLPEKSDHPIQGHPTNFTLRGKLESKWQQQIANETHGDYMTTYAGSYIQPTSATTIRYATPKAESSTLHAYNKVNKDLNLRGASTLKAPEPLPSIKPVSAPISAAV